MNEKPLLLLLLLMALSSPVSAQTPPPVAFCEKGDFCWTEGNVPGYQTELKIKSADPTVMVIVPPGVTKYTFADHFRTSKSPWICGHARGIKPDGTKTSWYISETEGVCNALTKVMPPPVIVPLVEHCQDGKDNDGDGKIDFPADPGCLSKLDTDETDVVITPPSLIEAIRLASDRCGVGCTGANYAQYMMEELAKVQDKILKQQRKALKKKRSVTPK